MVTQARMIAARWIGTSNAEITPSGGCANAVFGVAVAGVTHFLRLTPKSVRRVEDVEYEIAFLSHLSSSGVSVSTPLQSMRGRLIEEADNHFAVLFRPASGIEVTEGSPHWNERFFKEWGYALAHQHVAARTFTQPFASWRRDWRSEPVLLDGLQRIFAGEGELGRVAQTIMSVIDQHSASLGQAGTIHADMAPQNFRYDPAGGIMAFDFDNCCNHFYGYDLAVSKLALRRHGNCGDLFAWIVEGYQERTRKPVDLDLLHPLLRLRLLYIYCDRLLCIGREPAELQLQAVQVLRQQLLANAKL